jgi:4-alpha-glucanotransferase
MQVVPHPAPIRTKSSHVAGVPPDYFSEDGQLWGNPLYDWQHHAATGYKWWIERMRASIEFADIVRIDHFRGFESYWSIPADADTARTGSWETGPGDALFESLSDALGTLPIVAEDLGMITPEVEALRDRHQLPGMAVLQFMICDHDFKAENIPFNCVCYTGTHDNDTTLGWFRGGDQDTRSAEDIRSMQEIVLQRTGSSEDTVSIDISKIAFSTPARIAIAPIQDILSLDSDARMNIPGTTENNWRWRMQAEHLTPELCDNMALLVHDSGRGQQEQNGE